MVVAIAGGLYLTKDEWLPKLKGIGKQYQTIRNDGQLAEGNFPIEINGGSDYQMYCSDDVVFLMSDAYIYYYNTEGSLLTKRQHTFSNAVLEVAGDNALIYESGGTELSVENEDNILYSMTFDKNIMFARLSDNGYTAVVTSSDNYACKLSVYDKSGTVIYERACVERISDISFTENGDGCVLTYIGASNGSIVTNVQKITFKSSDEVWTSPDIESLGLETYAYGDGAFLIGYTACSYIDISGKIGSYYEYEGDFAGGDSEDGKSAVIINDDDRRVYTLALFSGESATPLIINFDNSLKYVTVNDGLAYVMTNDEILAYDFTGSLRSTADVSDSYSEFRRNDDYVFLMSYNGIDRIDYNS
jgi:hypothetical protein